MKKENTKKIILDLCGGTGSWSKPYKDAGYDVRLVTLPEYDVLHVNSWQGHLFLKDDENAIPIGNIYGILAAPPCTQFSFARQRYKTPPDFVGAMVTVEACLEIIWECQKQGRLQFWALENPVGHLMRFLGRPHYKFYQWQFGGQHVKPTAIWGWFNEPTATVRTKPVVDHAEIDARWSNPTIPPEIRAQFKTTKDRRAAVRAITPPGFARAFFKANP